MIGGSYYRRSMGGTYLHLSPVRWVAPITTQNLMTEGDNLEVLKLLQKSYAGRVKLIYIDPPYNKPAGVRREGIVERFQRMPTGGLRFSLSAKPGSL